MTKSGVVPGVLIAFGLTIAFLLNTNLLGAAAAEDPQPSWEYASVRIEGEQAGSRLAMVPTLALPSRSLRGWENIRRALSLKREDAPRASAPEVVGDEPATLELLNALGRDRWELVSHSAVSDLDTGLNEAPLYRVEEYVFKRKR
ncbi:MAG: hypothetical protein HZB38_04755 [Planctomycetes bacterium]|nr:hypothetical protein [Planctomycetota bacterium]